jgi:flagellar protein FlaG
MSSEINPLGASGVRARVAHEPQVVGQLIEPARTSKAKEKPNLEIPKVSPKSLDSITSRQNVKEAVDLLNNQMASNKRGIGFTVNNDSNTPIVTVRNTSTGEVVRQIPNEVVIKLATGLDNTKGVIHNKQA